VRQTLYQSKQRNKEYKSPFTRALYFFSLASDSVHTGQTVTPWFSMVRKVRTRAIPQGIEG